MKTVLGIIGVFLMSLICHEPNILMQRTIDQKNDRRKASEKELTVVFGMMRRGQYSEARSKLDSIYSIATSKADTFLLSATLGNLGNLSYRLGEFNEGILYYERSLEFDRVVEDSVGIAAKLKSIGIGFRLMGVYDKAIDYYNQALAVVGLDAHNEVASIYNSIGNLYNELEQYEKSYDYFLKALNLWESVPDTARMAIALGNVGNALQGQERLDEAISKYEEALGLKVRLGKKSSIAITLSNLGEAYFEKKDWSKARDYFLRSLKLRQEIGENDRVAIVANNLAKLELEENNITESQKWIDKALQISEQTGEEDVRLESLRLQRSLYISIKAFEKAIQIDSIYDNLRQITFDEQVVKVQRLQYEFDIEQKDKEQERIQGVLDLAIVQGENERIKSNIQSRTQQFIIAAAVLTLLIVSYFAYRLRKKNQHIENLIRELHHRVKNHLGMISGMFGAQTGLSDLNAAVLDEAKTRVEAVNGIHRRLYRQDEYEFVNMQEYLEELVDNNALVFGLFNKLNKEIEIKAEVMEIDKAISVGLIANEVLTNAFKYGGLQQTHEPVLKIVLEKLVTGYRMVIFNNASSDASTGRGFGAELINRLAQNLKGSTQVSQENGFQFELTFP